MLDTENPTSTCASACPLCDGDRLEPFMMFPDAAETDARIWQCLDCFAHIPEMLPADEPTRSIPGQAAFHEGIWNGCTSADMQQLHSDLCGMVDLMSTVLGEKTPDNLIVELGAGRGALIRALLDRGYRAQGCEPAPGLVALAREHFRLGEQELCHEAAHVYLDRLESTAVHPQVIVLWHVLEHVSAPLRLLERCLDVLALNGSLILQLPLIDRKYIHPAHYFFVTPESIPVIARRLGGLRYRWEVDFDNKYITVYLGGCVQQAQQSDALANADGNLPWRAARARAEPAITRDGAISGLLAARAQKDEQLREALLNNERLLAELTETKKSEADALLRLEWAARTDDANLRLISSLSDRINVLEETLRDVGETDDLKADLSRLASTVEMQAADIAEHLNVRQGLDLRIEQHVTDIQSIEALLAIRDDEVATQRRTISDLEVSLAECIRIGAEKERAISAQARMIEQRWDAMQEMGSEIAKRDRIVFQHAAEIESLSSQLKQAREEAEKAACELANALRLRARAYDEQTAELQLMRQLCAQKDDAIRGQSRMVEERWDAMQSMGSTIAARDAVVADKSEEIDLLSRQLERSQDVAEGAQSSLIAVTDYVQRLSESFTIKLLRKLSLIPSPPVVTALARSRRFSERSHNRYWWHRTDRTAYVPLIYDFLAPNEWSLLDAWFNDTEQKYESTGEANIPPLSLLFGLISGNGLNRVVQCGHYVGYSTLLLGFLLRRMKHRHALYSIDIDQQVTAYTRSWLKRAGLMQHVQLSVADSADPAQKDAAFNYLGGAPQLVFIDSSHQYAHTLRELDLWYGALETGGLIVLHDTSLFAASLDRSGNGGVRRAVGEWCSENNVTVLSLNHFVEGGRPGEYPYLDGCGLSIIQKT